MRFSLGVWPSLKSHPVRERKVWGDRTMQVLDSVVCPACGQKPLRMQGVGSDELQVPDAWDVDPSQIEIVDWRRCADCLVELQVVFAFREVRRENPARVRS